jgi:flagellar export protein FliJ
MRGLKTLLHVRELAEEKALEALAVARRDEERIKVEERTLRARIESVKESLRAVEQGTFGVRESLTYRRYLNAVRSRIDRCRARGAAAGKRVEETRKEYEKRLHGREAVEDLIKRRMERAAHERERRDERVLADLAQTRWIAGNA